MQNKLQNFINTYTGIPNVGNTPQNKGQCVGLISVWMDTLGIAHEWGNACDLLTNANKSNFDVIYNTPTGFPLPGDIMVWGTSWGAGYGHTGVIVTADVNKFTCFEQNNPTGHAPQINGHTNYNGVLGWLHPKVTIVAPPSENPLLAEWRAEGNTGDLPLGWSGPGGYPTKQAWYAAVTGDTSTVPVGWNGPDEKPVVTLTPVVTPVVVPIPPETPPTVTTVTPAPVVEPVQVTTVSPTPPVIIDPIPPVITPTPTSGTTTPIVPKITWIQQLINFFKSLFN